LSHGGRFRQFWLSKAHCCYVEFSPNTSPYVPSFVSVLRPLSVSSCLSVVLLSPSSQFRNLCLRLFVPRLRPFICHFSPGNINVHCSISCLSLRPSWAINLVCLALVRLCFGLCTLDYASLCWKVVCWKCNSWTSRFFTLIFDFHCTWLGGPRP